MNGISNVTKIARGQRHTLFVKGQQVFGCGTNHDHRMSSADYFANFYTPTLIFEHRDLRGAAACYDGSFFITFTKIFAIGESLRGSLGTPDEQNDEVVEVEVPAAKNLRNGICMFDWALLFN